MAYLRRLVLQYPHYFLDEYQLCLFRDMGIVVCLATVWRSIKALGFTRHKLEIIAKQKSEEKQAQYLLDIGGISASQFVFLDEVHCDKRNYERHFGWALSGRRAVRSGHYVRGNRYSTAAAMSSDGVFGVWTQQGAFTSALFTQYVMQCVIPNMNPYPGAKSVLVLDNGSIHSKVKLNEIADAFGIKVVVLPPYSPTFNPIENVFSKVKAFIARHANSLSDHCDDYRIIELAFQSVTASDCVGYFSKAGYIVR